jgi:hypothetical protein
MNLDMLNETVKRKEDDTWALLMNLACQQMSHLERIKLPETLSSQYLFTSDVLSYSFKLKVIKLYDDNNWLHDKNFFHHIFMVNQVPQELFDYVVNVCDKHGINMSTELYNDRTILQNINISNLLTMVKFFISRDYEIDKDLIYYIADSVRDIDDDELMEILLSLIDYGIDIYNDVQSLVHALIRKFDKWENIKWLCDLYVSKDYPLENVHRPGPFFKWVKPIATLTYMTCHSIEAFDYIIDYYSAKGMDIYQTCVDTPLQTTCSRFTDEMICSASPAIIKHALHRGIIFTNNVFPVYAACYYCNNGEYYNTCNYRSVTTNFISVCRYGVRLDDLIHINDECPSRYYLHFELFGAEVTDDIWDSPAVKIKKIQGTDRPVTHYEVQYMSRIIEDPNISDIYGTGYYDLSLEDDVIMPIKLRPS